MIDVKKTDGADFVFQIGEYRIPVPHSTAVRVRDFLSGSPGKRIWESNDAIVIDDWSFAAARTSERQHQRDVTRRRVVVTVGSKQWHLVTHELEELGRAFATAMK